MEGVLSGGTMGQASSEGVLILVYALDLGHVLNELSM